MNRPNKGFTLMELLIVIGVLGILAAGLLAAIDPFEQLKKARDTNNRNAATEFLQASQRYYATHGYLPWYKEASAGVYTCAGGTGSKVDELRTDATDYPFDYAVASKQGSPTYDSLMEDCVNDTLLVDGEVKDTFFNGLSTSLYVTSGSPTRVAVCFAPEGKSNRSDSATAYNVDPTNGTVVTLGCSETQRTAGQCVQCFQ